ncbi:MAG: hypothetical protein NTV87_10690, partial [Ignavibacteriae bacterium]|nr:hypothetical protein [Ignavibacteriota bacterium]
LYDFDSSLLSYTDTINALFAELESNSLANIPIAEAVGKLGRTLDELLLKFDERENLLRSFS